MKRKGLVIITSKENFVWTSMTEIIPWIEETWGTWALSRNIQVTVVDVGTSTLSTAFRSCLTAHLIVVTCFNLKIAKFLFRLRSDLSVDVPCAFYLHNQATIGCWPLHHWKLIEAMSTSDVFIGTCFRDAETMNLCFKNSRTEIIPFSLSQMPEKTPHLDFKSLRNFAFIGRISVQKNLHTLIWALSLMKEKNPNLKWKFHLFGADDELGSPLMGLPQIGYEKYLKDLVKTLHLTEEVIFHGFVTREEIASQMNVERWIFVSPGLHADENFGMAAFRCLMHGHLAVLSDWGGHSEFINRFKAQAKGVRVYESTHGPWIDPSELADTLLAQAQNSHPPDEDTSYYRQAAIFKRLDEVWATQVEPAPLVPTPLARDILTRRELYCELQEKLRKDNLLHLKESHRSSQIFESYKDKLAQTFHRSYGMENVKLVSRTGELRVAPWVHKGPQVKVRDPHRGDWIFPEADEDLLIANGWATKFNRFS